MKKLNTFHTTFIFYYNFCWLCNICRFLLGIVSYEFKHSHPIYEPLVKLLHSSLKLVALKLPLLIIPNRFQSWSLPGGCSGEVVNIINSPHVVNSALPAKTTQTILSNTCTDLKLSYSKEGKQENWLNKKKESLRIPRSCLKSEEKTDLQTHFTTYIPIFLHHLLAFILIK